MMLKPDEGYIKFKLSWKEETFDFGDEDFQSINSIRGRLVDLGLIGVYPDEIGFGNVSLRYKNNQFIITGSATGGIENLEKKHFALVTKFNIQNNQVYCQGLNKASSESLSHGAIYTANNKINAIIHVHHLGMWEKYLNILPSTPKSAEFGTPEIARLIAFLANHDSGIIVMGGHPEGIITYGKTIEEAYEILIKYYNNS